MSHTVPSRGEAAAVLVAPFPTATPWRNVASALKPAFTMTGDTAATLALPATEAISRAQLDAISGGLAMGLPQSSTTGSVASTLAASQGSTTTGATTTTTSSNSSGNTTTTTSSTAPGTVPTLPSGAPASASLPALASLGALGQDPTLRYKSANYLIQTVQLLNEEIDDVASRRCYVPFVERLKLAVMPYQPGLAYSAHTHIAFFTGKTASGVPSADDAPDIADDCRGEKLLNDPGTVASAITSDDQQAVTALNNAVLEAKTVRDAAQTALDTAKQTEEKTPSEAHRGAMEKAELALYNAQLVFDRRHALVAEQAAPRKYHALPQVIPLLAADDLDVAMHSQSSEVARQLSFALNFMVHGVGGAANANALHETLTNIANQDLTSSLTISRDNDNTLYVEIAPANVASGRPMLVGQTYDVAVLLLVPRAYFGSKNEPHSARIGLVSSTDFRDAHDGAILPVGSWVPYVDRIDAILRDYIQDPVLKEKWLKGVSFDHKVDEIKAALSYLQQANYRGFYETYFYESFVYPEDPPKDKCWLMQDKPADPTENTMHCFPGSAATALWAALVAINDDSPYKYALFEAPVPAPIRIHTPQTVLLPDDQSHPIAAMLSNIDAQSVNGLAATLDFTTADDETICTTVKPKPKPVLPKGAKPVPALKPVTTCKTATGKKPGTPMHIPLTIGTLDTTSNTLALSLPSLAKIGVTAMYQPPVATSPDRPMIHFALIGCDPEVNVCPRLEGVDDTANPPGLTSTPVTVDAVLYKAAAATPPLTISPSSGQVMIAAGSTGTLTITVSGTVATGDDGIYLSFTGTADPVSVTNATLTKLGYKVIAGMPYTINFANLAPGQTISLSVQGGVGGKLDRTLPGTATFTVAPPFPTGLKP